MTHDRTDTENSPVMFFQQVTSEPVLFGGIIAGAGLFEIWRTRTILEVRDTTRKIAQSLYGAEGATDHSGVISVVHSQTGALGILANETADLDRRVTRVEGRCDMTHNGKDP